VTKYVSFLECAADLQRALNSNYRPDSEHPIDLAALLRSERVEGLGSHPRVLVRDFKVLTAAERMAHGERRKAEEAAELRVSDW
jgi:hypothetical protein